MTAPRHQSRSTVALEACVSGFLATWSMVSSTLDGACQEPAYEVALQGEEDEERHQDGDEGRRRQDFPVAAARAEQGVELGGQHDLTRLGAEENHCDQQIVPHPQKLEDRERGEH